MLYISISIFLIVTSALCLYRGIYGPTVYDRVLAINVIGTKTTVIIALIGFFYSQISLFVDIAIVYAMLNFIMTLVIGKYLEKEMQ